MQHKQEVRWIQLPVRLEASQAELLDKYAQATRINKSQIVRSAVGRFISELEKSGIRSAMERIHAI
jgi:predicted DNA-binding protein